ncbi:UNVERIFIED_CONTAM: hypothetical protein FKN15_018760 [Acipenser sinensis]
MPMGLCNAPPTFQRLMELVLRGMHWQKCVVYLDDVIVFGRNFTEHISNLRELFSRFREAGLKLKSEKCQFFRDSVVFLGHQVSAEGIQPDPKSTARVQNWPTPKSVTEVRAFLGLCSYYRRFVLRFAYHAAPLHQLTQKNVPFKWSSECEEAFQYFKKALTSPPIMAFPDFQQQFTLYTDASLQAIGSVLTQKQKGKEQVIAYASHVLTQAERNWSTYDRELWAIVWSVRHFRHYLRGNMFVIITDHKPLMGLKKLPVEDDPTGRRARWAIELDLFQWEIQYRRGRDHNNADSMSRRPSKPETPTSDPIMHSVPVDTREISTSTSDINTVISDVLLVELFGNAQMDIAHKQQHDPLLCYVFQWKRQRQRPAYREIKHESPALKKLWRVYPQLVISCNILYKKAKRQPGKGSALLVVVPESLKEEAMTQLHGHTTTGHLGIQRTLKRAWDVCYWPTMSKDLTIHCTTCLPCQARAKPNPLMRAPMQTITAKHPFEKIAADITELPLTARGYRYVLVVQDYFSKYVNLYPLQDQRASTIAVCLFERYVQEHGLPEMIHTDQGRQFEADLIQQLCTHFGINKTRTTAYHPQGDGLVERFNRTLKDQLAKILYQKGTEWDEHLGQVQLAYNTSVHSSTGYTPFFLVHGREAKLPVNFFLAAPKLPSVATPGTPAAYITSLQRKLSEAFRSTQQEAEYQKARQKQYYDQKVRHVPYQPNDLVWMNDPVHQRHKLAARWKGPFRVVRCIPSQAHHHGVTYEVTDPHDPQKLSKVVHYNRLKPYITKPNSSVTPGPRSPDMSPQNSGPVQLFIPPPLDHHRVFNPLHALSKRAEVPVAPAPHMPSTQGTENTVPDEPPAVLIPDFRSLLPQSLMTADPVSTEPSDEFNDTAVPEPAIPVPAGDNSEPPVGQPEDGISAGSRSVTPAYTTKTGRTVKPPEYLKEFKLFKK